MYKKILSYLPIFLLFLCGFLIMEMVFFESAFTIKSIVSAIVCSLVLSLILRPGEKNIPISK